MPAPALGESLLLPPKMRKIVCIFFFIVQTAGLYAQTNTFPSSGNVGVGTTSPSAALHIKAESGSGAYNLRLTSYGSVNPRDFRYVITGQGSDYDTLYLQGQVTSGNDSTFASIMTWDGANGRVGVGYDASSPGASGALIVSGYLGIGTNAPAFPLEITASSNHSIATYVPTAASGISDFGIGGIGWQLSRPYDGGFTGAIYSYDSTGGNNNLALSSRSDIVFTAGSAGPTAAPERMRITGSGNVGIGTASPSYPLSVNGTIQAKEVIVNSGWSDYIFGSGYRLAPLSEVAADIRKDGHLPNIPSAKEVSEHGVSIGAMESKLLAEVEKLTLHAIEQERRLDEQSQRISVLEAENNVLNGAIDQK